MNVNDEDDAGDSLLKGVSELIADEAKKQWDADFESWCDYFSALPKNYKKILKEGLIAHVELQSWNWIQHGLDLIESRKATAKIQLYGGKEGADYTSYLPYPVFLMGAEVFLKGMWLCQREDLRKRKHNAYFSVHMRKKLLDEIINISREHDLLKIIEQVEAIEAYAQDLHIMRFLKVLSGVTKEFYLPVTEGRQCWACERYPKRFYNDTNKVAYPDALKRYPEQKPLARLFKEAAERLDIVWKQKNENE